VRVEAGFFSPPSARALADAGALGAGSGSATGGSAVGRGATGGAATTSGAVSVGLAKGRRSNKPAAISAPAPATAAPAQIQRRLELL
jgi:hypothetical protein